MPKLHIGQLLERILDTTYPRRCVLCLSSSRATQKMTLDLCDACQNELDLVSMSCFQCGIPLNHTNENSTKQLCGQCLQKSPSYDRVIGIYHYRQPLVWLVQQMKFHKKALIAQLLAQLMSSHLKKIHEHKDLSIPDAIIPVPLHHKRQHERHFNQAEELANTIAQALNCPLDTQYIERTVNTKKQSGLDAKQRRKNVRGVFQIKNKRKRRYQHIALIDDVMSTGSTVNEISRLLKKSGIKKIEVWVLARASKK